MLIIEKYCRHVSGYKKDMYKILLKQLYELEYIVSQEYNTNEYEELIDEIKMKIDEFNRKYNTNVDLLLPHFNSWYIQIRKKYNELITGIIDGTEN